MTTVDPNFSTVEAALLDDDLQLVIDKLLPLTESRVLRMRPEVVMQAGRLRRLETEERKGLLSRDELLRERAQLRAALVELVGDLRESLSGAPAQSGSAGKPGPASSVVDVSLTETGSGVFLSYAWANQDVADEVDAALLSQGIQVMRDVRDAPYRSDLPDFMDRLGKGDQVVLLISDGYLKSRNCMYEAVQFLSHGGFRDRALPIVLPDATVIYHAAGTAAYLAFWDQKIEELNATLKNLRSLENADRIVAEVNHCSRIRATIDAFMNEVQRMNTLSLDVHRAARYRHLVESIQVSR